MLGFAKAGHRGRECMSSYPVSPRASLTTGEPRQGCSCQHCFALIACWVAFPLLLALLAYGCGAFVERASGRTLPLTVLLPCGVALMIGVLDLFTRSTSTVSLAIPAVTALAAGGLVLRPPWRWRFNRALVPATIVFAVYGAPIVLSGTATWAGYVKLDDTATWLALVDRTLSAGHTLAGLAPSTYTGTLGAYLTDGYPVGSFLPLGLGHAFLGEDIAWLTNPWMAFMAGMLALSLYRIARLVLGEGGSRRLSAAIAVIAAQPALLYGYYLWGGMKEMAGAMLVASFASAASLAWEIEPRTRTSREVGRLDSVQRLRALIPALVVVWAILAALSTGGLVWLVPGGVLALLSLSLSRGMRRPSMRNALLAIGACGVAAYLALRPGGFVEKNRSVLTGGGELGNLLAPLHLRQIAGIWPAGDFRLMPSQAAIADLLIVLALVLGAGALVIAVRRAQRSLVLYVLCSLTGALVVFWIGSPWLAGKALATASPAVAFVALIGCAVLFTGKPDRARTSSGIPAPARALEPGDPTEPAARPRKQWQRVFGALAGTAIAAGIVWSNVLGYHDVSLAPRAQLAELAGIGEQIAGEGPTLMTDYSPYGARHFLREAEPESASELRTRADPLRSGQTLSKASTADIDRFQLSPLLVYRTLVLRRSPVASRPPSPFKLVLRKRYWDVWQRPQRVSPPVLAHLPLGRELQPGAVPSCVAVNNLAHLPGARELIAVPVENPIVAAVGDGEHTARWDDGGHLRLAGAGMARFTVTVARAGHYEVWLGGSIGGPVGLAIDGTRFAIVRYEIQEDGQYVPFGEIDLTAGTHTVSIGYDGGDWRPGSGGPPTTVGPLVLRRVVGEPQPLSVPVGAARSLCGRTLDWIEALGA
jgi:hypothetical protein